MTTGITADEPEHIDLTAEIDAALVGGQPDEDMEPILAAAGEIVTSSEW